MTCDRNFLAGAVKAAGQELLQLDAPAEGCPDYGAATMRPVRLLAKRR